MKNGQRVMTKSFGPAKVIFDQVPHGREYREIELDNPLPPGHKRAGEKRIVSHVKFLTKVG